MVQCDQRGMVDLGRMDHGMVNVRASVVHQLARLGNRGLGQRSCVDQRRMFHNRGMVDRMVNLGASMVHRMASFGEGGLSQRHCMDQWGMLHDRRMVDRMVNLSATVVHHLAVVCDGGLVGGSSVDWHGVDDWGVNKGCAAVVDQLAVLGDRGLGDRWSLVEVVAGKRSSACQQGREDQLGTKRT